MTKVSKGEKYTVEITDYTDEGLGVGKIRESFFPLFIKNTAVGDKAEVEVIKDKKTYGYGRMLKLIKASPDRTDPVCAVFDRCGGCQLRHIRYDAQLEWKQKRVADVMERIGGLTTGKDFEMHQIIGMDDPNRYRNKAQYPAGKIGGKTVTGFYAGRTHCVIPTEDCMIEHADNAGLLELIRDYCDENKISTYDEKTGEGLLRHILIRTSFTTEDTMVCLVINAVKASEREKKVWDALAEELKKNKKIKSFILNFNDKDTNVILGKEEEIIYGDAFITDYISDVKFRISAGSFFQVNPVQTKLLYEKAMEYAALSGKETVWDLYCGIGTISLFLAGRAKRVYGVEIFEKAVEDAKANAGLNNITNAEFICAKAEDIVPDKDLQKPDVIVVDPPRKGCDARLLETIREIAPKRLVYVSCNPATLARDAKILGVSGFDLKKLQPVDMFPETTGVENVALFEKNY